MDTCKIHGQITPETKINSPSTNGCMLCKIDQHDYDSRPMSWEEIGDALGISAREAREIAATAIRKLSRSMTYA